MDRFPPRQRHPQDDVQHAARAACERARDATAQARETVARLVVLRQARQVGAGRRADDARRRGELTLQDLWLRYWALGGTADWLELDGYLAGLLSLGRDQQVVLLQALRERRFELTGPGEEVAPG